MGWWKRRDRGPAPAGPKKAVPAGVWTKCDGCAEILVEREVRENLNVCPRCGHHYPLPARERVRLLTDPESFTPIGEAIAPADPLGFKDEKRYRDRIKAARKRSGLSEAALVGLATLEGRRLALGALAFEFMGGSMGSVVGERITRLVEVALAERIPCVIVSASGGARMQEGVLSLMQMAKTSAALGRLRRAGLPYISVLAHPTTGGVAASFSMLGDIIIAEPGALIGFAGPRVIEQTIRQSLPDGFQRSEFLLRHGMIDLIVPRAELRERIAFFLGALAPRDR